jgi:hypothetical protein
MIASSNYNGRFSAIQRACQNPADFADQDIVTRIEVHDVRMYLGHRRVQVRYFHQAHWPGAESRRVTHKDFIKIRATAKDTSQAESIPIQEVP